MSAPDSPPVVHGDERTPPTRSPGASEALEAAEEDYSDARHVLAMVIHDGGCQCQGHTLGWRIRSRDSLQLADAVLAAGYVRDAAGPEVEITYRNYRGEVADRRVRPLRVWFGATEWHPEPQWLLDVVDAVKGLRSLALSDVIDFGGRGSMSGGGNATK